jgi:hypothetical protein
MLGENIARATVEHHLGRVDSRLGHIRHTVTGRARAAQVQAVELSARRECPSLLCHTPALEGGARGVHRKKIGLRVLSHIVLTFDVRKGPLCALWLLMQEV